MSQTIADYGLNLFNFVGLVFNCFMQTISAYILTAQARPRREFDSFLESHAFKIYNAESDYVRVSNQYQINQNANSIFLGRPVTEREKKCLFGHIGILGSSTSYWTLVFEDDAIIDEQILESLMKSLEISKSVQPTIVLLYIGKYGVFSRRSSSHFASVDGISFRKCLALPSGAVAYAVNKAARKLICDTHVIVGTADWPTYSAKINYFGLIPTMVKHDFELPSITQVVDKGVNVWPTFRYMPLEMFTSFFRSSVTTSVGGKKSYWKLNIWPALIRRLHRHLRFLFYEI